MGMIDTDDERIFATTEGRMVLNSVITALAGA